ncbi:MAG: hypothetical protein IAI50_01600 [Candidatus Eremiobacteraeota bacterium]|nr:hypothetical protein [Candidatus Eremiobacteraeota bacterium]
MANVVEISGSLQLSIDEREIDVTAFGSRVRVEIGDLAPARPTFRFVRSTSQLARRLARALNERRLTLVVTRHGSPVVELGSGVRGGALARILGLGRVRVYRRR